MSSTTFSLGDLVDEAVENAGLDPAALTHRHLVSITRSLELLFIELETSGANAEYRMETKEYDIDVGDGGVVLEADTLDVTQVTITIQGKPYPLGRSTREDFLTLSFPAATGAPSIFYLSKSNPADDILPDSVSGNPGNTTPILQLWPLNGLTGDATVRLVRMRQHAMPSNFGSTLDTRRSWMPTLCLGLAAKIASKYNPADEPRLDSKYRAALLGREADEDHQPVIIGYRGFGWGRSRRH